MKKSIYMSLGIALLAIPFISLAADVNSTVAQPPSLIVAPQPQGGISVPGSVGSSCPSLARSLTVGARGSDVTALQQFLSTQGYFSVSATGYFGEFTKAAVGQWQAKNSVAASGSAGFGIFGPMSRAQLMKSCGSTATTGTTFFASPSYGTTPLLVQFSSSAPQGSNVGNAVNFGDGTSGNLGFVPVCSSCNALGVVSHTYTSAGTYTATLTSGSCSCPVGQRCNCPNMAILGNATVTVSATSTTSNIKQLTAPGTVSLQQGDTAEIRNESAYFTLESLSASSATIQPTPVGCWNSFPSDTPPKIRCMLAMLPIPPQTLSAGQSYTTTNYVITLTQISDNIATFSVSVPATAQ